VNGSALWDVALWLACASALVAAGLGARASWRTQPQAVRAQRHLLVGSAVVAAAAFLWLLSRFVAKDVSVQYVFLYTHSALPLQWRIAGTWAGREGSLLLWTMDVAIVAALLAWRHSALPALDAAEERGRAWTRLFLSLAAAGFLAAVAAQHTFTPTPQFFLQGRPQGNGLNPTLKSAFILIHPPVMFAAYALATVPAAAVLGHLASGTDRWSRIAMPWARVDWLLYTFAMGLGGMWAYYTLGFGGYWAWDPVEVANLLPWLALTVYLHAQLHHVRYGSYKVVGPFLGLLPFLLTLFSTISTRSGLWVSVHAFTDPANTFDPDAPARFLDILSVEGGLLVYVRLFLATLGLGLALWCLRMSRDHATMPRAATVIAAVLAAFAALGALAPRLALSLLFEGAWRLTGGHTGLGLLAALFIACVAAAAPALAAKDTGPRRAWRLDLRLLAAYSVLVLGLTLLVLFLLHMAAANGWDTAFYEHRLPLLATPGALGLFVLQAHSVVGRRASLWMAAGLWAAAGAAALVVPAHREGAYLLVLGCGLVAVALWRTRDAALASGMDKRDRLGPSLLAGAGLVDLLFWLNPPSHIGWGRWAWQPLFPAQILFGAAAAVVIWAALRLLSGAGPPRPGWAYAAAALLLGFGIAPLLALAGWIASRSRPLASGPVDARSWARLKQVGLYGAHLAIAVALLGYAPSTYWKEKTTADVAVGDSLSIGPAQLRLASVAVQPDAAEPAFAQSFHPRFERAGSGGALTADLGWEGQVGAHFPLPATLRAWNGDLYVNVQSVHIAASPCSGERTLTAYQAANPPRACAADLVDRVVVDATWLPGLGLMWTSLALLLLSMGLMMKADGELLAAQAERQAAALPVAVPQ
jgi:cytochrome c-type biogenesis protein CcmF